jgi:hypothetical protein
MNLTATDYKHILRYYNKDIPIHVSDLKEAAENVIALKLCRCVKKLEPYRGPKSIGICTKTVVNSKGYIRRGKFKCNMRSRITIKKRPIRTRASYINTHQQTHKNKNKHRSPIKKNYLDR